MVKLGCIVCKKRFKRYGDLVQHYERDELKNNCNTTNLQIPNLYQKYLDIQFQYPSFKVNKKVDKKQWWKFW